MFSYVSKYVLSCPDCQTRKQPPGAGRFPPTDSTCRSTFSAGGHGLHWAFHLIQSRELLHRRDYRLPYEMRRGCGVSSGHCRRSSKSFRRTNPPTSWCPGESNKRSWAALCRQLDRRNIPARG
uniref:Uncharacterized protein n=1 Tax=Rhipicephalus microplus TaxID=6941 RepID=A0A6G5AG21_RHIMP